MLLAVSGYVKLRREEDMLPHNRRATYETIQDEDEGVYTRSPSDTPNETDSARSTIQEQVVESDKNSSPETTDLTETESAAYGPPVHDVQSTVTDSTQTQRKEAGIRAFGPQHPNCDPNKVNFTRTERRLSGMMRMRVDPPTIQKNRSKLTAARSTPNLVATDSPKNSGSSGYKSDSGSPDNDAESGYGYTTITKMTTPRPLKENRLDHTPQNTSEIPDEWFNKIEVPFYDNGEERGNTKRRKKFFESRHYLNSDLFMRSFADIFYKKIGTSLGFEKELNSATTQGNTIYCDKTQKHHDSKTIKIRHEIIPTIFSATWPEEALQRETSKRGITEGSVPHVQRNWPNLAMMNEIKKHGCHLFPLGYMPTHGRNDEQCLEWQLAFPKAERYLEARLTHAQVRCLLFSMALYKTFLEPLNRQLGLLPIHIRTLLFWQCENHDEWPEDRPGEILLKFLEKLYDAIKNKHLEDYFIENRNLFESTPRTHLLKVQEKLLRIRENLVIHVLLAVRNLRYKDTAFYPVLDCKKLYDIIVSHENLTPNPQSQQSTINIITPKNTQSKQQSEEEESDEKEDISKTDLWKGMTRNDKEKKWKQGVRTQIMRERAALQSKSKAKAPATRQRKLSTDSIDIKV